MLLLFADNPCFDEWSVHGISIQSASPRTVYYLAHACPIYCISPVLCWKDVRLSCGTVNSLGYIRDFDNYSTAGIIIRNAPQTILNSREKNLQQHHRLQRFDAAFKEFVDLDADEELLDLEKLNVVVTPILVTPPAVSWYYILAKKGL